MTSIEIDGTFDIVSLVANPPESGDDLVRVMYLWPFHAISLPERAYPLFVGQSIPESDLSRRRRNESVMDALDLTRTMPRSARADELGILFLARTIDKARASLPGGSLGQYRISAADIKTLSAALLQKLGLTEASFVQLVADAESDEDIVRWIGANVSPVTINEWNAWVSTFRICDCSERGRISLYATNPSTANMPLDTLVLDALDYEDATGSW